MQTSGLQLNEWLARLETYSAQEIDLGLERVQLLLQRLNLSLPKTIFHVAGTNGKGSSVAMLEALLLTTGDKVGCYTSPHLLRYNERIRVDGAEASDAQIVAAFESVEALRGSLPLTYFEFGTLAALAVFVAEKVDIAVLEVGLGGRLDAVNAVEPTASLITNISLDHCDWLGDNVEDIAREKAGVMRAQKAVVFAAPEMPQAIAETAQSLHANLLAANRDYRWTTSSDGWSWEGVSQSVQNLARPQLAGDIQLQNAAGVLTLLESAGFESLLDSDVINAAFSSVSLAGRMQLLADRWVLDVAHNPAAACALAAALRAMPQGRAAVTVIGMLDDKDVAGVVEPLNALTEHWIAVTADSPRAIAANELARRISISTDRPCWIAESFEQAIERAEKLAAANDLLLVTGSFYTVGAALVILAAPGPDYG
jgi:dihydrofolate synthase/folylpolyglutamate synthase